MHNAETVPNVYSDYIKALFMIRCKIMANSLKQIQIFIHTFEHYLFINTLQKWQKE